MYNFKKALTVNEQIEHLKRTKRVVFNKVSETEAKDFLYMNNYINVISPLKLKYVEWEIKAINNMKIPYPKKSIDGNHVYVRDVDFQEYIVRYETEKKEHKIIFSNILEYEKLFNSIFSYHVFLEYNIRETNDLIEFLLELKDTLESNNPYPNRYEYFRRNIDELIKKTRETTSCYILFNNIGFSELLTLYILSKQDIKNLALKEINGRNEILKYNSIKEMEQSLFKIITIRNCICHGNSLEILRFYHNIKECIFRTSDQRKKFNKLIHDLAR
jgi:hypothetical protein